MNNNSDARVKYLLKEMTEEHLAKTILDRDTAMKKKKLFHDIVVMFTHTATDILNLVYQSTNTQVIPQLDILNNLRHYANDQFTRVGRLYKCKHPEITSGWEFIKFV